jgi:hypothetical protein
MGYLPQARTMDVHNRPIYWTCGRLLDRLCHFLLSSQRSGHVCTFVCRQLYAFFKEDLADL